MKWKEKVNALFRATLLMELHVRDAGVSSTRSWNAEKFKMFSSVENKFVNNLIIGKSVLTSTFSPERFFTCNLCAFKTNSSCKICFPRLLDCLLVFFACARRMFEVKEFPWGGGAELRRKILVEENLFPVNKQGTDVPSIASP